MEDALREDVKRPFFTWRVVLILVLMEDALRDILAWNTKAKQARLNPCSNGRCSASFSEKEEKKLEGCLNPCSNGRCSASTTKW